MMKAKRGQEVFGMPFSIIFSLFLIAIFLVVAFFAIKYFLDIKKCSETGIFIDDFQVAVNDAWRSTSSDKTFSSNLPSSIEYVCFANLQEETSTTITKEKEIYQEMKKNADYTANLYFYPGRKACVLSTKINYINISEISNPYCFEVENGKIEIKLEKSYEEALVRISRT